MNHKIKGSAIMWAVCVMAISLILISGVLGIAQIYHNRTVADTKEQQALYTAVSAVSMVSDDIQNNNYENWISTLWNDEMNMPLNQKYTIENLAFDNADMGTVNLTFEWNSSEADKFPYTMKITAVSVYYGEEQSVSADFEFNSDKKWIFLNYCD